MGTGQCNVKAYNRRLMDLKGRRMVAAALLSSRRLLDPSTPAIHEKSHERPNQEYDEQYLGDSRGRRRNAAEAKHSSYQSDDKKYNSVVKHARATSFNGVT
jgi:hypothetical protein